MENNILHVWPYGLLNVALHHVPSATSDRGKRRRDRRREETVRREEEACRTNGAAIDREGIGRRRESVGQRKNIQFFVMSGVVGKYL
jgi:ribonuclease PH